ncbi:MAG: DUF1592 domain-containing protein [Polyangiaceae bacterium]|jgi:hypothetical protein|nr:DUF1592 domain-containing protein [Polyangiaceae bacterium]
MLLRWLPLWVAVPVAIGCTGEIGNPGDGEGGSGAGNTNPAAFEPASPTLHRLTQPQLVNAWIDLLGEPLAVPANLPQDDVAYGFTSIAAASRSISGVEAEEYETATYDVLDQVWADPARRDALVGCPITSVDDACVQAFLAEISERAWRRPLEADELTPLVDLARSVGADLADPAQGVKFALAAVLQSPSFLFRVEVGEPDPEHEQLLRFTSWEMASRLSFLLLDAPPDDDLRAAAAAGDLTTLDGIAAQAERLVDDPRARPALVRFFRDFMNIRNLAALKKNAAAFPQFTATLGPAMQLEIERMFENVVFEQEGDFRQLFTTRETYLNEELARVYGVEGITGPDFHPYLFPEGSQRAGLLTTAGFLAMNAHETQTSPTHRGRFVQINLLCNDIPPPPPGVSTTLPEPEPGAPPTTLRERLDVHRTNPECAGCHARMDPIGFAFEHYDALGTFRTIDENGLTIDSVTEVEGQPIADALELGDLIAELPQAGACVARRFFEHAGGHLAGDGDQRSVDQLVDAFVDGSYDFKELVVALVVNDGYRYASPAAAEEGN